jgi:hypothetical protein
MIPICKNPVISERKILKVCTFLSEENICFLQVFSPISAFRNCRLTVSVTLYKLLTLVTNIIFSTASVSMASIYPLLEV